VPNMPEPMAGEIWDVVLDPHVGREQAGYRPALVISNDYFNQVDNGLHIIAPITSRNRGIRQHVSIVEPEGGIKGAAVIMCDQAKAQSTLRFRRRRGKVSDELLKLVQQMVGESIDR
jgi:mRNA interferase MazF